MPSDIMASRSESDNTSSSNDHSDGETQGSVGSNGQEEDNDIDLPTKGNVASILKRLQSTGALLKHPKKEYRCFTCDIDFDNWADLETHLIQHVSVPSVVIKKLPSDDEDSSQSGDENWSDEEDISPEKTTQATPQKIVISQILNQTGITLQKTNESDKNTPNLALTKLSGLGFTIKKNSVTIKKEPDTENEGNNDVIKKLGQLGGIKLKLKSDGNNSNTFKVINGLNDFQASDDEDSDNGEIQEQNDDNAEKSEEVESSTVEHFDSGDDTTSNKSDKIVLTNITVKSEPIKHNTEPNSNVSILEASVSKLPGRPAVKQTPKRGANLPAAVQQFQQQAQEITTPTPSSPTHSQSTNMTSNKDNVVVKEEVEITETQFSRIPLFSSQIKAERNSPSPQSNNSHNTPALATVKSDPDEPTPEIESPAPTNTVPLLPIAKTENTGVTIIEIQGDSNDEDDDCCVVSATPAPDIKPVITKVESVSTPYPPPTYPSPCQPSYPSTIRAPSTPSTEKQHNFNWNAPDSKPPLDSLEKSADDMFESLLSTPSTKKDTDTYSEYISLDTLGPQHTCDVCNTRFTDLSLLEEHKRFTGHSKDVIKPISSQILPYSQTTNILSSLLPVKVLADQVGKLSTIGNGGPGFTHQQNVMINIQAYSGAGGVIVPTQPYNSYPPVSGQNMHAGYPANPNSMFTTPDQGVPLQYQNQHYGQQGYNQFQTPMSKSSHMPQPSGYPVVQNTFPIVSTALSTASPLQSMQQAYGGNSSNMMNTQSSIGQMGPPGTSQSQYVPTSSPSGAMKPPVGGAVKIHNVQTFTTGHMSGQSVAPVQETSTQGAGQMSTNPIKLASGANVVGARPRMPAVRNIRPSIRPGIQVHGQVRGLKPGQRMPLKRPAGVVCGPGQKRRPDMLLPGKHDNEDCQVLMMQKQQEGLPLIQSVQGAKDKINLGSQISITKKTVNKEANAMANVLASRGISVKQKQKSRSPTPDRPVPHIPNLGAGVSIKHTSKSSSFTIPEAKVGGGMTSCKICKKMFMNLNSLEVHMTAAHPNHKIPIFKCDECPASYPKSAQLQYHKRMFHNVIGPNRELGLPVVDLSQEETVKRLNILGITNFIPLVNREQASGCFGIPILSAHNIPNGTPTGLSALGAEGLLSLGPLKPIKNP
ncbi:hypothetical protein ACJJTC_008203 [Scirpophaga incertulas]